jgi:hypothetical protein
MDVDVSMSVRTVGITAAPGTVSWFMLPCIIFALLKIVPTDICCSRTFDAIFAKTGSEELLHAAYEKARFHGIQKLVNHVFMHEDAISYHVVLTHLLR